MYAIFETGGKQYQVAAGDVIRIERIAGEAGEKVKFANVIAFADGSSALQVGTPYLDATVNATITNVGKGEKVIIFKFKSKKDYRKKQGHRQPYTEIEIDNFTIGGKNVGVKPEKAETAPAKETEKPAEEKKPAKDKAKAEPAREAALAPDEAPAEVVEAAPVTGSAPVADVASSASKLTKADIMEKLDGFGVEYSKSAKKDELLALLEEAERK